MIDDAYFFSIIPIEELRRFVIAHDYRSAHNKDKEIKIKRLYFRSL